MTAINSIQKTEFLRRKLALVMLIIGILILTSIQGYFSSKNLTQKISAEGRIASEVLAAAIIFNDANEIENAIQILNADRDICSIKVLKNDGNEVTRTIFHREDNFDLCHKYKILGIFKNIADIDIDFKSQKLGNVFIEYSYISALLQIFIFGFAAFSSLLIFGLLLNSKKNAWQIELGKYQKSLKELIHKNASMSEEINKQIAFEIHDQIGQLISTSLIQLNKLENISNGNHINGINLIKNNLNEANIKIRNISKELHPVILKFGISVALEDLAETKFSYTGHKHEIIDQIDGINIPENMAINLYRIAQEAYTNVLKHSNGTIVTTRLWVENNNLFMSIEDDGNTFSNENYMKSKSLGLVGINERVTNLGGFASIEASKQRTVLTINIPGINYEK